ncbi:MAG: HD domain-containing protein [Acidobacteriota bacterium]
MLRSALDLELPFPEQLQHIAADVRRAGGRLLVVGGSIRDGLLGRPVEDLDLEVYGLEPTRLEAVLARRFELDRVGQSFGVLKLRGLPIDVALPRRESKRGLGHRGFEIHSDPNLPFAEAARRRDFTINALGLDPRSGEVLDAHGGRRDLRRGVLRHVSEAFAEDPLRVLRAMQFAARLCFEVANETIDRCRTIDIEGLASERIFEEWRKLVLAGREISRGLDVLRRTRWLRYFPELAALVDCPQDPTWHPEGDVWRHTLHVMDAFAARRLGEPREDLIVGLACLCHDLGKPATTRFADGRWRSPGHEADGDMPTRRFLGRMTSERRLIDSVVPLVREHLKPFQLFDAAAGPAAIRRLARRVGRIDRLARVARADHAGRPPLPAEPFPAVDWLEARAAELALEAQAPKPIVLGRHLLEMGFAPGPALGRALAALFERQLDGVFEDLDGGRQEARRLMAASATPDEPSATK